MDRARAIKRLEYKLHDIETKKKAVLGGIMQEPLEMAISALREQEQREQGCVSCNGGFGDNTMEFKENGYLFCPMCGRKLKEGAEGWRKTDYTRKCGTCTHFERKGEWRHGWCHRFPYNENVVCDPKHPYPQRAMSATCAYYFDGRQTNAGRIRAMTDEELAEWLMVEAREVTQQSPWCYSDCDVDEGCPHQKKCCIKWLQQPCGGADHE